MFVSEFSLFFFSQEGFLQGLTPKVSVIVQAACGEEKIIQCKVVDPK